MKSVILTVALLGLVLAVALVEADDEKNDQQKPEKKTFFGVDADDAEAVKQKHAEMSEENARRLFGDDHKLDQLDFSPDFNHNYGDHIKAAHEKVSGFVKQMLNAFFPKKVEQGSDSNSGNDNQQNPEAPVEEVSASSSTSTLSTLIKQ